uniref:sulfate/molybdate ABC transporter ATP-binding protein n=1 Tax=Ndongobacter massiliensis TaxID=1871025 RepID=UPI000930F635|nr:ATP-binding cassette domain-containing protein [Ndongobacter massiliensis]
MLACKIKKDFKNFKLDIDFTMENETLALLGASGSGKTLTLQSIAGLIKPDWGKIVLNGRVLFDSEKKINCSPQERRVGYLFQDYALFPNFTVRGNVLCGLRGDDVGKVEQVLNELHIAHIANKYPAQISGGEKQRTALARILVNQAEILLLDEPFSAIDSFLKDKIEDEVLHLIQKYQIKTILVSHNKEESYRLSDSIVAVNGGKNEKKIETDRFFRHPPTLTAAKLIGIKNFSRVRKLTEDCIRTEDWGINLQVGTQNVKDYVGIFSDKIWLSEKKQPENSFLLDKFSVVENIDHYSVTCTAPLDRTAGICFAVDKAVWQNFVGKEKYINIDSKELLFFDA